MGAAVSFHGRSWTGALGPGAVRRYSFAIRATEPQSTATGSVLVKATLSAPPGSLLDPELPAIPGLVPLSAWADTAAATAVFAVDRGGLYVLELTGGDQGGAGVYEVALSIAGDVDFDGFVDGADHAALAAALGSVRGEGDTTRLQTSMGTATWISATCSC